MLLQSQATLLASAVYGGCCECGTFNPKAFIGTIGFLAIEILEKDSQEILLKAAERLINETRRNHVITSRKPWKN